jgi:hypothetical protein
MPYWQISLRERVAGWVWECRDQDGRFVCESSTAFKRRWQAVRNFELRFEDHWPIMTARNAITLQTKAKWVCGL